MVLNRGWLCFICRSLEDAEKILGGFWLCHNGSLMVKRWYIGFNPDKDFFQKRHIWVLLPRLPLQLWDREAFVAIGNELGHFLFVEENLIKQEDKRMGKLLVEIDVSNGLLETLDIDWRGNFFHQKLGNLGIPFQCSLCYRTRHLRRDCKGLDDE